MYVLVIANPREGHYIDKFTQCLAIPELFLMQVPIKAIGGKLYVRIAVHVYNCIADYQRLADAIDKIRQLASS